MIHVYNLIAQNFIIVFNSKVLNNEKFVELTNKEIENVVKIQICASLSKKWSYKIMQKNNAYVDIFENSNCHDDDQFFFPTKTLFETITIEC